MFAALAAAPRSPASCSVGRRVSRAVGALLAWWAFVVLVGCEQSAPPGAVVVAVQGDVQRSVSSGFVAAQAGDALAPADHIKTGPGAFAIVGLTHNGRVTQVDADVDVVVERLAAFSAPQTDATIGEQVSQLLSPEQRSRLPADYAAAERVAGFQHRTRAGTSMGATTVASFEDAAPRAAAAPVAAPAGGKADTFGGLPPSPEPSPASSTPPASPPASDAKSAPSEGGGFGLSGVGRGGGGRGDGVLGGLSSLPAEAAKDVEPPKNRPERVRGTDDEAPRSDRRTETESKKKTAPPSPPSPGALGSGSGSSSSTSPSSSPVRLVSGPAEAFADFVRRAKRTSFAACAAQPGAAEVVIDLTFAVSGKAGRVTSAKPHGNVDARATCVAQVLSKVAYTVTNSATNSATNSVGRATVAVRLE